MTSNIALRAKRRERRAARTRSKLFGTASRPRLSVYRSAKHVYAQAIDDETGKTIFAASSSALASFKGTKRERAAAVGKLLAEKAREFKIAAVVFDRGEYAYHGRVREIAEALRAEGITV